MVETVQAVWNMVDKVLLLGSCAVWLVIVSRLLRRQPLVAYEPRPAVPWSGLDVSLLVFLSLAFSVIAMRVTMPAGKIDAVVVSAPMLAAQCAANLVWIAIAIVYLAVKVGAYIDDLGLDTRKLLSDVRLGVTALLAVVLPVYGLQAVLVQWFPSEHPLVTLIQQQKSMNVMVLATIAAVVVAPIFEEFMFRVVLQGWLEKQELLWLERHRPDSAAKPGAMPIVVVSTLFALLHWGHGPDPIPLFVLALFLGYTYQQTHRIFAPLVIHVGFNALAISNLWLAFTAQ